MANTKISNLTSAGTLTGTEVAPIVQSSNTVKVTTQNIANLALPSQAGNANKYLQTNGTVASWASVSAGKQTAIFRVTTNGSGSVSATEIQGISGTTWAATISGSNIVLTPTPNIFTFNSIAYGSTGITSGSAILFCIPQSLGSSSQTFSFYNTSNAQVNMSTTATASGQYIVLTIIIN
jgi:hypothetical protein